MCFPTLSEAWKHISMLYLECPWENRLWSVSKSADCHPVVTQRWHLTGNEAAASCWEPPACFRNPKGWTEMLGVRSKKTGIWWSLKQLLGRIVLGLIERKMRILSPMSVIQIHTQYVYLQYGKFFQNSQAHWISPTEKTRWITRLNVRLAFPVSVRTFPMLTLSG